MQMPGRFTNSTDYRYGYNGMEKDKEIKGDGNSYTTEFRQYDPRLGRWLSLDPLMAKFPWMSPYVAFDNNPIFFNDPLGLEAENVNGGDKDKKKGGGGDFKKSKHGNKSKQKINDRDKLVYRTSKTPAKKEPKLATPSDNTKVSNVVPPIQKPQSPLSKGLSDASNGVLMLSISQGAIEHFGGVERIKELLDKKEIQAVWNGQTKTWSVKFQGNKYVPAKFVSDIKLAASTATRTKVLNVVKAGGIVLTLAGAGISTMQYANGDIGPGRLASDYFFTGVALKGGPVGFVISGIYFMEMSVGPTMQKLYEGDKPFETLGAGFRDSGFGL